MILAGANLVGRFFPFRKRCFKMKYMAFRKKKSKKTGKRSKRAKKRGRKNAFKKFVEFVSSKLKLKGSKRRAKVAQRKRRQFLKKFRNILIILAVLSGLGVGVYFVVRNVIELKLGSSDGTGLYTLEASGEDVVGIEGVPEFPGSEFLFKDHISDEEVQDFLAEHQSAYSIPLEATWGDVTEFYKRELEKRGWAHVNSIDRSDELRMYGEYWIKVPSTNQDEDNGGEAVEDAETSPDSKENLPDNEEVNPAQNEDIPTQDVNPEDAENEGRGLRIFTRLNDIWYQEISVSEAQTGMASVVAQRSELDFLISMSSGEQLPKEVPWVLRFAPVWDYELKDSEFSGVKIIEFTNPETSSRLIIQPIAYVAGQDLETLGREFIEEGNFHRDEDNQFEIKATSDIKVAGVKAVIFNISSPQGLGSICILPNEEDDMIYAIAAYKGETAFFNYVIENLELPKDEEEDEN